MSEAAILETMTKYTSKFTFDYFNHGESIYNNEIKEFLEDFLESMDDTRRDAVKRMMKTLAEGE